MEEIFLEAQVRQEIGRAPAKKLRTESFIPAVLYWQEKEPIVLKIPRRNFLHLIHEHRSENIIISLQIKDDTKKKSRPCLIKEVQHDPVKGDIVHLDFQEISLTKTIKVNVPIATKGESIGVKQDGGSLEHILWEIEVECLPTDIPKSIEVDISSLKLGDNIHIKDIKFPGNIKVINEQDAIVITVAAPMKEEVPADALEGEAKVELEVIKEKKPDPEAEGKEGKGKEEKK